MYTNNKKKWSDEIAYYIYFPLNLWFKSNWAKNLAQFLAQRPINVLFLRHFETSQYYPTQKTDLRILIYNWKYSFYLSIYLILKDDAIIEKTGVVFLGLAQDDRCDVVNYKNGK